MNGVREGSNPFVGPRSIQQGEPLYGRDTEVHELYNQLQARRIVVLHSPSGAGKSSLVQAGLIPRLRDGNYDVWKPIRVNLDPTGLEGVPESTNRYLLSAMVSLEDELPTDRRKHSAELATYQFLEYLESRPRRKSREGRPVVLLFDQFEEVLTVAPRVMAAKREFFAALGRALDSEKYWALFIIREDYLGALAPYRDRIPTQMSNTFRLDLLSLEEARGAALKLAEQGGRSFPAVDQLMRDLSAVQVQQPDGTFVAEQGLYVEPVQLQVVCRRLWDAMPADHRSIDASEVKDLGNVDSALASYYDEQILRIVQLACVSERRLRDWVDTKLISRELRTPVMRGVDSSEGLTNQAIDLLESAHLIRGEDRRGVRWYELSHDRLVAPVRTSNAAWKQDNLHPVQQQAALWDQQGQPATLLLGDEVLAAAAVWTAEHVDALTPMDRLYLERSQDKAAERARAREAAELLAAVEANVVAERAARHVRARRRARWTIVLLSTALIAISIAWLAISVLYRWETASHFNTFVRVFGVPRGIGPLTEEQIQHRRSSIRIVTAGLRGPVQRLERIDRTGRLKNVLTDTYFTLASEAADEWPGARWAYEYDQSGAIISEMEYDRSGRRLRGFVYPPTSPNEARRTRRGYFVGPSGAPQVQGQRIVGLTIEYTEQGFDRITRFQGVDGTPVRGRWKQFANRDEYDAAGNLTARTSLDKQDRPMVDSDGNASAVMSSFTSLGDPEYTNYLDAQGNATNRKFGESRQHDTYDEFGNVRSTAYFDSAGSPVVKKDDGWHRVEYERDGHGNITEERYFGTAGTERIARTSDGCSAHSFTLDEYDRMIVDRCRGADGAPAIDKSGCATWKFVYDASDRNIESACFGGADGPITSKHGYHRSLRRYDENDDMVQLGYVDTEGGAVLSDDGFAGWTASYDDHRLTRQTTIGVDGKPVLDSDGVATREWKYEDGRVVERRFYGIDQERLTFTKDGYAGWRSQYDSRGNEIRMTYFGTDEQPTLDKGGVATIEKEFDDFANPRYRIFRGVRGEAVTQETGIGVFEDTFDPIGNVIEETLLGADRSPTVGLDGYATSRWKFDAQGNQLMAEYFDVGGDRTLRSWKDDTPHLGAPGYHRKESTYDTQGRLLTEAYSSEQGRRLLHPDGWWKQTWTYDEPNNSSRILYLGLDGKPTLHRNGYHVVQYDDDSRGARIKESYYEIVDPSMDDTDAYSLDLRLVNSTDGYAQNSMRRDPYGRMIESSFLGSDESPAVGWEGFHRTTTAYDNYGNIMERRYYNAGAGDQLDHIKRLRYDERGRITEWHYLSPDDKPALDPDTGCAVWKVRYRDPNDLEETVCLDRDGESRKLGNDGWARRKQRFGGPGELLEQAFFDPDERPILSGGYASVKYERDAFRRATSASYFDENGRPGKGPDGAAIVRRTYDTAGNLRETILLGPDEKPLDRSMGYARHVQDFDHLNRMTRIATFGVDGKPRNDSAGVAERIKMYDDSGNLTEIACYDERRHLVMDKVGYARVTFKYDDLGQQTERVFFDAQNRPIPTPDL